MRTLIITLVGFVLWGASLGIARRVAAGKVDAMREATVGFVTIWFLAALTNLWAGLARAGSSLSTEVPEFAVIFGVPTIVAMVVRWKLLD